MTNVSNFDKLFSMGIEALPFFSSAALFSASAFFSFSGEMALIFAGVMSWIVRDSGGG